MKIDKLYLWVFILWLMVFASHNIVSAQEASKGSGAKDKSEKKLPNYPADVTTSGSITITGQKVNYKAIAGVLPLKSKTDEDKITAQIFYVAYFKDGVSNPSQRPVTFLYNGGPGSATLWLHMGSFGPKRVVVEGTTHTHAAPYALADNEFSLLDVTDLVFIDMPGTGFGRILEGEEKNYWGVDEDAGAFSEFIQTFITKYNRWNSPKFLFGESYGTLRSAVVAGMLHDNYKIDVNGIILLSQILNYGNSVDRAASNPGGNYPFKLALPTYAATAWYHKKLPGNHPDLRAFLDEVEHFAMNDYSLALDKGIAIDQATEDRIAAKMHEYTGLPVEYIKKAGLKIDGGSFRQQLLNDDDESTGRLDTRFSGPTMDPLAQRAFTDPQSDAISGAYVALLNDYLRNTLKYGGDMVYNTNLYGRANWNNSRRGSTTTVNVMGDLANTMKKNPYVQVLLTAGYYDLATPYFEGVYELQQLPIPKKLGKNIHFAFYESGHMIYLHMPSLEKLHNDVKKFILDYGSGK